MGEGFDAGIVNVSEGSGNHQGKSDGYHLAQFKAGKKFTFQSGSDTLVQGIVQAPRLQGKIGGNITFKSLQDTDGQQGWQQQLGVSLTVGPSSVSGSINVNKNQYRSDYASVQQPAGLKAGDQGFQLQVNGNTHLARSCDCQPSTRHHRRS